MTELEQIALACNAPQTSCSCTTCANMCKHMSCIGTPEDIQRIIDHGHIDKLAPTIFRAGRPHGIPDVAMVQIDFAKKGNCPFLNADDRCELHNCGLKPTEGKLAHHSRISVLSKGQMPVAFAVAATWLKPSNYKLIINIIDQLIKR